MKRYCVIALLVAGVSFGAPTWARTPSPAGAEVYIISPADGATVTGPVTVRFGARNVGVAPAGVDAANTGHHHLIVDADLPPFDQPVPKDDHHRHYGGGQTEVTLDLPPGRHTLQLLMGDAAHVPHEPALVSKPITITVQ